MKIFVPVFMLCLGLTVASPAFCQKKKAKVLFDAGVNALEHKDYAKALKSFQDAYEVSPHWAVLAHIGTCFVKMGQPEKAIESFEQYLEQGRDKIPPDERKNAEEMIVQEKQKIGVLVLSVAEDGIEALIDGASIGTSPYKETVLKPGTHEIVVRFAENDIVKRDIEISGGQELVLRVERETHVSTAPQPVPVEKPRIKPVETQSVQEPAPVDTPPAVEDKVKKKGSPVPFGIALGVTIADAAAVAVSWALYGYNKQSASNYGLTLDTLAGGDSTFSDYSWDQCIEGQIYFESLRYYCNTESARRDFDRKTDIWKIVGIATSSVLGVTIPLTIVFGVNRHWFGGSKGDDAESVASFSFVPVLGPDQNGIAMGVSF